MLVAPISRTSGFLLVDHVAHDLGVCVGGVVLQQGAVADHNLVGAVAAQLLGNAFHVVAQQQAGDLAAQLVSQLAGLADQLEVGGQQSPWRCSQKTHTPL